MIDLFPVAALLAAEEVPEMDATFITAMTITGLSVVFVGLLILVGYLTLSGTVFKRFGIGTSKKKKEAAPKAAPKAASKAVSEPAAPISAASDEDADEIAAVIAAVVAAMSAEDGKTYAVRSVKPVRRSGGGRSAWAQAGLSDLTAPFSIQ